MELCAEDSARVPLHAEPIRAHRSNLLASQLIEEVNRHVSSRRCVLKAIVGEVARVESVAFLNIRVLELA